MTCAVDGCPKGVYALGLCCAHRRRLKRYGDPLDSKQRPVAARRQATVPGHPLGDKIRRARVVLYDKLDGHGAPCHWCAMPLRWIAGPDARRAVDSLCADHLDGDTTNDDPANLVPSCRGCNANRSRGRRRRMFLPR